jgi:hypothetical protein
MIFYSILYAYFVITKILKSIASCWCLIPVILATQKAEIRRIEVQSQPEQIVLRDPILKKPFTKKGWWSGSRYRP